jgi:hypothetical protein
LRVTLQIVLAHPSKGSAEYGLSGFQGGKFAQQRFIRSHHNLFVTGTRFPRRNPAFHRCELRFQGIRGIDHDQHIRLVLAQVNVRTRPSRDVQY